MTPGTIMMAAQAGELPSGSIFGMPPQGSTIAPAIDLVYDIITWISIMFFVNIVVVIVYFMFKYRRTAHVANTAGPTHNTPLEVTWSVIPLILVIAMFYVGLKGYVYITTPPENSYQIQVMGQRWFWTFNHPNGAAVTNVLQVPVGRPVRLLMRSDDVIHSLFIPAFRVKQDVVPGRRTELWFEATRTGDFDLFCSEYCGTKHSQMVGRVLVYEEGKIDEVITDEAEWIKRVPDDRLYFAGTKLYNQCSSCHTLDGSKLIGPSFKETFDLLKSGGARTFADGSTVKVDQEYLRQSILHPLEHVVATYPSSMPPGIGTQLGPRKIEAMVGFISRLDETAPGGKLREMSRDEIIGTAPETK